MKGITELIKEPKHKDGSMYLTTLLSASGVVSYSSVGGLH